MYSRSSSASANTYWARWALRAGGPRGEFLRALALFNAKDYREALKLFRLRKKKRP